MYTRLPLAASLAATLLVSTACRNDVGVNTQINVPPAVVISGPANGEVFETGALIRFEGVVSDGNRLTDITRVWWTSDQDGELGIADVVAIDDFGNTRFDGTLSDGLHTITLAATDGAAETASDSISIEVIGGPQVPVIEFIQPEEFDVFELGEDIDIVALVSDPQDSPDDLWVTVSWEASSSGGVETFLFEDMASANGSVRLTWEQPDVGTYTLALTAEDTDGNLTDSTMTVFVSDPNDLDNDGDGFSLNTGDCDDTDPTAYPGAPETCGDGDDNNCNGIIDDKDLDNDGHIDMLCASYSGGLPVDDCDDNASTVFPGATETLNGVDDDCDGYIDEGTVVFDDDGDCFCEQGPCTGSFVSCSSVTDDDCNDANAQIYPGAPDTADTSYADENCDGIDGVVTEGVFVASSGSDSGDCTFTAPCQTINYGITRAIATNRAFVNIRAGTYTGSVQVSGNVTLVGGFDGSWSRANRGTPGHAVRLQGTTISGEYVAVRVLGSTFKAMDLAIASSNVPGNGIGKSSYGIHASGSASIDLQRVDIDAGDGGPGAVGLAGDPGPEGSNPNGARGSNGENYGGTQLCRTSEASGGGAGYNYACNSNTAGGFGGHGGRGDQRCCSGACALCNFWNNDTCDAQGGAGGGNAAIVSGGNGRGGNAGAGDPSGGCTPSVGTGQDGGGGASGTDGIGGSGASSGGSLNSGLWWRADDGATGWSGTHGGGGGGGGGAGACDDGFFGSDFGGNGGGGGGAGGCRADSSGQGGSGAGGSFGIFAIGGAVTVNGVRFTLGAGGDGGDGGDGGLGGDAGSGGFGGSSTGFAAGRGGTGGRGGHSGGGGGGGGGHSVGIYSVGASVNPTESTVTQGAPGTGGAGGRSPRNTTPTNGGTGATGASGLIVTH